MEITWFGHSCFRISDRRMTSVVCDPYDNKEVGYVPLKLKADIVTVSHDSPRHKNLKVVYDDPYIITGPGEYEIGGVSIIGIPFYHDNKKGEERGRSVAYIFEIGDIRLLHLGDLGHQLTSKDIDSLGDINVLFVPVGGKYTIGPSEAVNVVKSIDPRITIPMHYWVEGMNPKNFSGLKPVDVFLKEAGLPVERLDKLVIKSSELAEENKIVVLNKKK